MRYLTALLTGLLLPAVYALVTIPLTGSLELFLAVTIFASVLCFLPILIVTLTNSNMPKPTLFGTSAPKTTDQIEKAGKELDDPKVQYAIYFVLAGIPHLFIFFIAGLIFM
ncbi:hypothetical protein B0H94_106126 [Salsuginibacillus halophilus]|uniref:Uncharacterized protein n=1 Tax=Salsuginibacillus halophilus TaxID=517424 RepID=A0A2P8HI36_9BACI|nr:hypothetical protein [Salsuginibacillus halophilus]PSL45871.1 hypothetical protein B0H94_106126 [Salsuginibacillus halophilus]